MKKLQFAHPDATFWDQTIVDDLFGDIEGNIFVIPGEYDGEYINQINEELNKYPYVVVMITSDENSNFPVQALSHPRMRTWVQYPKENTQADHFLPAGWSPRYDFSKPLPEKSLNWFWGGQVTHQDRIELVEQLRRLDNGFLLESEGFTQGIDLVDYLDLMARAKVVPIPRGNVSPDTMRLYDALQLGCIPIIRSQDEAFYKRLLGDNPFPVIGNWAEVGAAIEKHKDRDIHEWWLNYKQGLVDELREDIRWLSEERILWLSMSEEQ